MKDENYLTKYRKQIKKIYTLIEGNINQNSMSVYSGPMDGNSSYERSFHECDSCNTPIYFYRIMNKLHRVGCIFTGDSNLNVTLLQDVYHSHWEHVGTIQIPHHGDLKSFNVTTLDEKYYCCPISYGKNRYGHPSSKVIDSIEKQASIPIHVTESFAYSETIKR